MQECPFYTTKHVLHRQHVETVHQCEQCAVYCVVLKNHNCAQQNQQGGHIDAHVNVDLSVFKELTRSHRGAVVVYIYEVEDQHQKDIQMVFNEVDEALQRLLSQVLESRSGAVVKLKITALMKNDSLEEESGDEVTELAYFYSELHPIVTKEGLKAVIFSCASEIIEKKNDFVEHGSGWSLKQIQSLEVKIGETQLFPNVRANGHLKMPFLRRGIVNFKNPDNKCFMYCVTAGLHWEEVHEKARGSYNTWKKFFDQHDFSDVDGGYVNVHTDIPCFEDKNECKINVFSHVDKNIVLIRESKKPFKKIINLFLIHEKVGNDTKYHFVLITNLNKFLATGNHHKNFVCNHCFKRFTQEKQYMIHISSCNKPVEEQLPNFPDEWKRLKFSRPEATISYPFLLYYDFETFGVPANSCERGKRTVINHEYVAASYSIAVVENVKGLLRIVYFEYYDGDDVVKHFFTRLFEIGQTIINRVREMNNNTVPTEDDLQRHEAATNCQFCAREFTKEESDEDSDHSEPHLKTCQAKVVKTFHHNHHTG